MGQICVDATPKARRDTRIAESIALETDLPLSLVQRIYDEEFVELARNARITQFIGVLAARRVRMRLRHH